MECLISNLITQLGGTYEKKKLVHTVGGINEIHSH